MQAKRLDSLSIEKRTKGLTMDQMHENEPKHKIASIVSLVAIALSIAIACAFVDIEVYSRKHVEPMSSYMHQRKHAKKASLWHDRVHRSSVQHVNNIDDIMKSDDTIVDAIEQADADDNIKLLSEILAKLQSSDGWQTKVSEDVQTAAVDAIESSSSSYSMRAELAGFLASPHEDVVSDALDAFSMMLEELDDDSEKARLLVMLSKAVTDKDFIEDAISEIDTMEADAKHAAIAGILKDGTDVFKSMLREEISSLTDDEDLAGLDDNAIIDKVKAWADKELADEDD